MWRAVPISYAFQSHSVTTNKKKKKRGARGLFIQTKRQIGRWVQSINVDNFETFQDITHVGDSTFLLNYIIGCENLRIGPLLFLHYFTSTTHFTDYSLSSHFESFHSTVFWTRFGSSLLMCSSVSNLPVVYWVFILGDSGRRRSRLPREAVKKF
jgi:hypothetical protein